MDSAPPTGPAVAPQSADELPSEAIALAGRFFEAARQGQMDIFEQGLPRGLPANLTNDKGDSLVSRTSRAKEKAIKSPGGRSELTRTTSPLSLCLHLTTATLRWSHC